MHISVCLCTYCRLDLLKRLLKELACQDTKGVFEYSIVIADNDKNESAKTVVKEFASTCKIDITYCVEPRKSIAYARNKSLEYSKGDAIAFIDDDEFPASNWLYNLKTTMDEYNASAVFGPVKPHFDFKPPSWIIKGGIYLRPEHSTGFTMQIKECRTGNVLIDKRILEGIDIVFRPQFKASSEDTDLFSRLSNLGYKLIWCNEAVVYEIVTPDRWKRSYMIKRALLRGRTSLLYQKKCISGILKSMIAVPVYGLALPFLHIIGHHIFMKYLIKLCDHLGKLLAFVGLNPVQDR